MIGEDADADRRRDDQFARAFDIQRTRQRPDDLLRNGLGVGDVAQAFDQQRELVATEARDDVALAHASAQAFAHRAQHEIAAAVTHRIVDVLEVVEIEEQHRDAGIAAARAIDRSDEPLYQQAAIRQSGQRVVVGEIAQILLVALAFGDVGHHADVVRAQAEMIVHGADFEPAEEFLPVLAPLPQLAAPMAVVAIALAHLPVGFIRLAGAVQQSDRLADDFALRVTRSAHERLVR